jgi:hypothetical protein
LPDPDVLPSDDGDAGRRLGTAFTLSDQDINPNELNMVNAARRAAAGDRQLGHRQVQTRLPHRA